MKKLQKISSLIRGLALGLAVIGCIGTAKAVPFASGVTNVTLNGSNYIQFHINESGSSVSVVTQPDGITNLVSASCPVGLTNAYVGANTSWKVYCYKVGTGTPIQITVNNLATTNTVNPSTNWLIENWWPTPRGLDCNKNPQIGNLFGRIYIGNGGIGNSISITGGVTLSGQTVPGTITNFRGQGLYALNADCTDALGFGTNAAFAGGNGPNPPFYWTSTSTSAPYKISVNPNDNTITVGDESTANGSAYIFDPNFNVTNGVYGTNDLMISPVGETQGEAAHTHADVSGTFSTGSIATSNLVLWTEDPALPAPSTNCVLGVGNEGQTTPGQFGLMVRYDIGAGPLPWPHGPNQAVNLGLPGFQDVTVGSVSLGPDLGSNFVYASYYRANLSDPCVQVFTNVPTITNIVGTNMVIVPGYYNLVWSSMENASGQMVLTGGSSDIMRSTYAGVRVSPDGKYIAAVRNDNLLMVCNLTNGIPDNSSFITIGTAGASDSRGIAFDAADNIYTCSSGTSLLIGYSLAFSATTVTGNDITGTNGTFAIIPPPVAATVSVAQNGSQNYVNNAPPGTPIPGIFNISLNTNYLASAVTIPITLGGTATDPANYTINSTDTNGVTYSTTQIKFPAGTNPATGNPNWSAQLICTPTATPLSGPLLNVTFRMVGGSNFAVTTPYNATLNISNTGPQYLFLSAASALQGPTMNRGIPNDYAMFVVTRWGDLNGPNNSASSITENTYTVTNITYGGSANFTNDYSAQAQRLDPTGNGVSQIPVAGSPGIVIYPGNVTINCDVGLPVFHTNVNLPGTNLTITVNLETATNTVGGTNGTSVEGFPYTVGTATETMTEIDNAKLTEVVIWNDPLTNSVDPGWTLVYASTNMNYGGVTPTFTNPIVLANYTNTENQLPRTLTGEPSGNGTNDFEADFGYATGNENSTSGGEIPNVSPSPQMLANGWTNVLRMTVNKNGNDSPTAINMYPTNQNFYGNVALRFEMYLSTYFYAQQNPNAGTIGREFALFGMNSYGTNCNWRPTAGVNNQTGGSGVTNTDGEWVAIDGGSGSLTPADYDAFNSAVLPNSDNTSVVPTTYDSDTISNPNTGDTGIFKDPPFVLDESRSGGDPANLWVEVSLEKTQQSTNFSAFWMNLYLEHNYVNPALQVNTWTTTNSAVASQVSGNYTNGCIMLGYEDPVGDVSDESAFVYYSNVRVVELAPFISLSPTNLLVQAGTVLTNTSTAIYSYTANSITNTWYRGTTTPATPVATNSFLGTNFTDSLVINTTTGSNYWTVFTDQSGGFATSYVASVEVINPPGNVNAAIGATATFSVTASGEAAPTSYHWNTNGVSLVTSTKYTSVTAATLVNQSVTAADNGTVYTVTVQNNATNQVQGTYVQTMTTSSGGLLTTFEAAPTNAVVTPAHSTNEWGSKVTFTVTAAGSPATYTWMENTTNLGTAGKYSGTNAASLVISNLTQADDSTDYYVVLTNSAGSTTSTVASLLVYVPQPKFTNASPGGTQFGFKSTNTFDNSNDFILLSSPNVVGPYTNEATAVFGGTNGSFSVTLPQPNGSNMFYQLMHVN